MKEAVFFYGLQPFESSAVDIVDKLTSAGAHGKFWEFP